MVERDPTVFASAKSEGKLIHFCGWLHELPATGRSGMVERDPTVFASANSEGNFY